MTDAARSRYLFCGDVVTAELVNGAPITLEYCQLSYWQFRVWMEAEGLNEQTCAAVYGISEAQVLRLMSAPEVETKD
jgi:hypothetical protein